MCKRLHDFQANSFLFVVTSGLTIVNKISLKSSMKIIRILGRKGEGVGVSQKVTSKNQI